MLRRAVAFWLPAALAVTAFAPFAYGLAQQSLRSGANDPQVALAQSVVASLDASSDAASVTGGDAVPIAVSLEPWVAVFDSSRRLVASSGTGAGAFPTSVFDSVPAGSRDEVTWQPAPGVRQATVVMRWRSGWVVAGRSLALVEQRESQAGLIAAAGWLAAVFAAAVGAAAAALLTARR